MAELSSSGSHAAAAAATHPYPRRLHGAFVARDSLTPFNAYPAAPPPPPPPQPPQSSGGGGGKISPAVLFIIVILAVVFFISGLLHLLVRLLVKKPQHRRRSTSTAAGRHGPGGDTADASVSQRLFHLHASVSLDWIHGSIGELVEWISDLRESVLKFETV
jgi:hypothetical protein